jgi:hypothetical protein
MTTLERLPWHRPRITTVLAVGPFLAYTLVTSITGHRFLIAGTPIVTRTDIEAEQLKARKAEQNRERVRRCYQRQHPAKRRRDCYTVEYNGEEINKLVQLGLLDDAKSSDKAAVGRAMKELVTLISLTDLK